jgi:hypothetical protein
MRVPRPAQTSFDGFGTNSERLSIAIVLAPLDTQSCRCIISAFFGILPDPELLARLWRHSWVPAEQFLQEAMHNYFRAKPPAAARAPADPGPVAPTVTSTGNRDFYFLY